MSGERTRTVSGTVTVFVMVDKNGQVYKARGWAATGSCAALPPKPQ